MQKQLLTFTEVVCWLRKLPFEECFGHVNTCLIQQGWNCTFPGEYFQSYILIVVCFKARGCPSSLCYAVRLKCTHLLFLLADSHTRYAKDSHGCHELEEKQGHNPSCSGSFSLVTNTSDHFLIRLPFVVVPPFVFCVLWYFGNLFICYMMLNTLKAQLLLQKHRSLRSALLT